MACIDLDLNIPTIPAILVGPPQLIPLPGLSGELCCKFSVNPAIVNAEIAAVNAAFVGVCKGLSAGIQAAIITVNETIGVAQYVVDGIKEVLPECPLDSKTTNVSF